MLHTRLALRRPVTTLMAFLATAAVGVIAAFLLPLEELPEVTFPGMEIRIPYPGSTAEEVERLVTRPVEEALATLPGIQEIRSTSTSEMASFRLQLSWDRPVDAAAFDVRTKVDSIRGQLPADADRVLVFTFSSADQPIVVVRLSANQDLVQQYDALERHLKKPLERIDGVARVDLQGVTPQEVRILVDSDRAAAHSVDLPRLRAQLERSNFSVSAGQITERGSRFLVRPLGEFRSLDDVRRVPIAPGVHLGDVAEVALVTPPLDVGRHVDRRPAVGLDVFKTTQANVVDVVDAVLRELEHAREVPALQGVEMVVVGNQAESIRSSLAELRHAGLIGAALALVVLYFFLRDWPTTLIVSLAVPASLVITLAALYFVGLTLNVLTMMGMLLAVGMLVDNAVVVTESIFRHRQLDPARAGQATLAGVREVGVATMAGTAATVIVFLPMVFGEKNEVSIFLTHVAIPIVVAMIASLLVAQTLVPLLAARLKSAHVAAPLPFMTRLQDRYARMLRWVLAHPWKTAGLVVLTLASVVPLFATGLVKVDPFPQDATRTLILDYRIRGNHPLEQVERAVNRVEAYLESGRERWEIDNVYSRYDSTSANTLLYLKPKREAKRKAREIMDEIAKDMPEVIIGEPTFDFNDLGNSNGFGVQLSGESTEVLADLSVELVRRLEQVPGFDAVRSEARGGDEEIEVVVDRARAMQAGLPTETVATTIAGAMRGDKLREFRGRDRELTMRLAFRADDRQSLEDLARLPIPRADGSTIPLSAVASFRTRPGERAIERVNRLTAVVVNATLAKGVTLDEMRDRTRPVLESFPWPPGYTWKFGRGFEQNDQTLNSMALNIGLAVVLIFLVMAALFESTLYPLSIVTSILFAMVGVCWFFAATGTTVTLMAMIGIMILVGVVVNIGIVLIAHVINLRAAGMERTEAIVQAGRDRLRPILMTTATTLLGLVPLGWGDAQVGGTGGPAYYPMARAIIGGLAFGAAVSLFFVPAFYVWFDDLNAWRARVFGRRAAAAVTSTTG